MSKSAKENLINVNNNLADILRMVEEDIHGIELQLAISSISKIKKQLNAAYLTQIQMLEEWDTLLYP